MWYSCIHVNKCICGVNMMDGDKMLYLVNHEALPEVLIKTVQANELIENGEVRTASEAIEKVGISRGAYYKYRDLIKPFYDRKSKRRVTLLMVVRDITGILSEILGILALERVSVLTINQNIPINGTANITITVDIPDASITPYMLMDKLKDINGMKKVDVISA